MGLRLALILPALCALAACDGGGFEDDVVLQGHGEVHGTVFGIDGGERRPVAGATVFLLASSGSRLSTTTASDGGFELLDVPAGPARLVVNDAGRRGSLRELDVYASGDNDAGELYIQPIEQDAALLDIPDVGFEERVTRTAANAENPVAREDGTSVYLHRRVVDDYGYLQHQLREIRVPSGEEVVLWPGNIRPGPGKLLDGRFVAFGSCVWDTQRQNASCLNVSEELLQFAWKDAVYGVGKSWSWAGQLTYYAVLVRHFARGGMTDLGRYDSFIAPLFSFSAGTLTAMLNGVGELGASLAHWDLETGEASPPIAVKHTSYPYYALVADGRDRAYYLADFVLGEVDFSTGTSRVLYENTIYDIWPAGPRRLILSGYLYYPGTSLWLMNTDEPLHWPVPPSAFTMLPREPNMTIGGHDVALCMERVAGDCSAHYLESGVIRIATHNPWTENFVVDVDVDGNVLRKRVLALDDPGSVILERPGGGQEAIARRDGPTGFIQLWVADLDGSDEPLYRQVTFLPADHGTPFYSPDGDWLYSFVRDPLSGYVQLFRVRVRDRR